MPHTGDFICNCNSTKENRANQQEDVLDIGTWEDFSGSGGRPTNFTQGWENKLQGTRADIDGEDVGDVTARGKRKSLYRQRDHLEYIEL